MGVLIDTSVFIAWERGEEEIRDTVAQELVYLSAITASELLHGVHRADSARRREQRRAFVESVLAAVPLLAFDMGVSRVHAQIWSDLRSRGQIIGAHDMIIGATAVHHGLRLATRNVRDFERIEGLEVVVV